MEHFLSFLQQLGVVAGYVMVVLLCLAGLVASCLSLFGAWLVAAAAALAVFLVSDGSPGWWMVLAFVAVAGVTEIIETFAGAWGVQKRGGSGWAGLAALVGGLIGMVLGSFIPVPVVGTLTGMLVVSFAAAYLVEHARLKSKRHAAHIAFGAVTARILVIIVKVVATLAMTVTLLLAVLL